MSCSYASSGASPAATAGVVSCWLDQCRIGRSRRRRCNALNVKTTATTTDFTAQLGLYLNDNVGLRDVDGSVPHLGEADAVHQWVNAKSTQDARPLALGGGTVDKRDP